MHSINVLNKNIKAVIFDMDGTLIDSTGIWGQIDVDFFKKRGFNEVPKEYNELIVHCGLQKGAEMTIERYGFKNDTVEGIIKEWTDASIYQYSNKIPLKPHAKELLEYFKNKGLKIALATANDKNLYEPCLKRLGVDSYFDIVVDVNMVNEGKSSPKIFNYVSEKLNVLPNETLVFEDSLMGLKTAKNAGYITIGVDDALSQKAESSKKENCILYIYDFNEILKILKIEG